MKLFISDKSHTLHWEGKDVTLQEYLEQTEQQYLERRRIRHPFGEIIFAEEELIWAIQHWYSCIGEFSEEELDYLEETWNLARYDIEFLCTEPDEEEE